MTITGYVLTMNVIDIICYSYLYSNPSRESATDHGLQVRMNDKLIAN